MQTPDSRPPDPVIEAYKKGIDRTLLIENLRKTPHQRLVDLQRLERFRVEVRSAMQRAKGR